MAQHQNKPSIDDLKRVIRTCPVIDNHAHNTLRLAELKTHDFLTITSEATGAALRDAHTSLAHVRAARQLRKLYDLPADASWHEILAKRTEVLNADPGSLTRRCFEGTQTLLIDDGLGSSDTLEPYYWHDRYTLSPCKRIVRIEAVAADILSGMHQQGKLPVGAAIADEEACGEAFGAFTAAFDRTIADAIANPEVVGFKSVVCYRTGLDVRLGRDVDVFSDGLRSFRRHFLPDCVARKFRVEAKGMNDALVISTCKLIAGGYREHDIAKPFQFHTGLGDNDISLLDANPACLQPLIAAYPIVPIVLLHSSYPYTREAGYLATVYKNCYLDIGEVFPMISRDGQEKILRQSLELTPWGKLLWSTDGHYFPETFWLANIQGREVMEKVFCEYVDQEDWTVSQAVQAAEDIFFENSNKLYRLKLKLHGNAHAVPERPKGAQPRVEEQRQERRPEEEQRHESRSHADERQHEREPEVQDRRPESIPHSSEPPHEAESSVGERPSEQTPNAREVSILRNQYHVPCPYLLVSQAFK
jgi:hypothetical protein